MTQKPNNSSDQELARLARAGSLDAFEELVFRYEKRLYGFLRHKTQNFSDAEDLVQLVFIKAYRNIGRYNGRYAFSTWLLCIARREAASHYRSNYRRHQELDEDTQIEESNPALLMANREQGELLWELAGKQLSDSQFNALWMVYHEGLSVKESAKVMKRTVSSVKVLLHRGRRNLLRIYRESPESWIEERMSMEDEQCFVS